MKVNMTPNPLDVVTIHASQGDTEARQWEFELHNNGELIDTSEITEQLFFKSYKGGTEQLLPENGSTPTTSPFLGDIRYPQGLLTDQEFTYRQSPTEEDGLAKITDIKGNTLVWNQLSPSKAFASSYTKIGLTFVANDDGSVSISGTVNGTDYNFYVGGIVPVTQGHKYLVKGNSAHFGASYYSSLVAINSYNTSGVIATASETGNAVLYIRGNLTNGASINETIYPQIFDLTQMGLDISDPSEFTSLFPLSYYSYNQGSLLSFNGNGIKTVGKNLFDETKYQNLRSTYDYYDSGYYCRTIQLLPNTEYTISQRATTTSSVILLLNKYSHVNESGFFDCRNAGGTISFVTDSSGCLYIGIFSNNSNAEANQRLSECQIQIEYGVTATAYEPYTSSTLSLPISTYFPNGMKSAGTVYDELLPNKAITRVGAYTITSFQAKSGATANNLFSTNAIMNLVKKPSADTVLANIKSNYGEAKTMSVLYNNDTVGVAINTNGTIYVGFGKNGSVTTLEKANSYVQRNPITVYYELATPTETSFTTASLVTENAKIPLSNEDGTLIGKCTEQLSENPGFIDAKVKLSDSDGECYSNKIQLHVERSPQ